jgi:hypothetical protein
MRHLLICLSVLSLLSQSASAEDYENIPKAARSKIKSKCVAQFPDDYFMQEGCINLQSNSYLKVHGAETEVKSVIPEIDVTGIPSSFDSAQMNNSAYLSVAHKTCKIEVGKMPDQYRERAVASDRFNAKEVDEIISGLTKNFTKEAKLNSKAFCVKVKKNFQNFVSDLQK